MQTVKGMVQVAGTTFRIVRVAHGHYEVIRILDDTPIGHFWIGSNFRVSECPEEDLLREVARCAIQGGKTSWIGRIPLAS